MYRTPVFRHLTLNLHISKRFLRGPQKYTIGNVGLNRMIEKLEISKGELESAGMNTDQDLLDEDFDSMFKKPDEVGEEYKLSRKEYRRKLRRTIVIKKYFEKGQESPKFLTYAAIQQIKHLHALNASDWTHEKLAESFPIAVKDIKKILRSNFELQSAAKIKKYDERVEENWKMFLSGRLNFKPNESMISRKPYYKGNSLLPLPANEPDKNVLKRPLFYGTFSKILNPQLPRMEAPERYVPQTNSNPMTVDEDIMSKTSYKPKRYPGRMMTADVYEDTKVKSKPKSKYAIEYQNWMKGVKSVNEQLAKKTLEDKTIVADDKEFKPIRKYQNEKLALKVDQDKSGRKDAYVYDDCHGYQTPLGKQFDQQKINVPDHLKYKNSIFRKGSAFYDSKGNFLYKVPALDKSDDID